MLAFSVEFRFSIWLSFHFHSDFCVCYHLSCVRLPKYVPIPFTQSYIYNPTAHLHTPILKLHIYLYHIRTQTITTTPVLRLGLSMYLHSHYTPGSWTIWYVGLLCKYTHKHFRVGSHLCVCIFCQSVISRTFSVVIWAHPKVSIEVDTQVTGSWIVG